MNALIVATIAIGLPVDQHWARYGQVMVSAATWLVLAALWSRSDPRTRPALAACLLFATAGEVFLSLVWTQCAMPAVNIPSGRGPRGLPLGIQVVGRYRDDERALQVSAWVEATLGFRPGLAGG